MTRDTKRPDRSLPLPLYDLWPNTPSRLPSWVILVIVLLVAAIVLLTVVAWQERDAGAEVQPTGAGIVAASLVSPPAASPVAYSRGLYRHWIDADGDCQDTRVEVLVDWTAEQLDERGCKVTWVEYVDPYTLEAYAGPARALDIDHVVPLAEAHRSGAETWTAAQREAYANDTRNLLPTVARWNRQKGDRDPANWMPPAQEAWCDYVGRWTEVKHVWGLTMDAEERAAVEQVAAGCQP